MRLDNATLKTRRALLLATAMAVLSGTAPAFAAPAADPAPAADEAPTEIVVTGSQVSRAGFTSPTPVTSLTPADLAKVGAPNIADALNQLPALKPSITPSSVTNLSVVSGGNFLDLRGLTYLRTLTLIDGKRYTPTTVTGAVNINLVPQALIGSADVVTGGASAAYGSDAVAGVVNLKLDTTLEGLRGSFQGGITDHNDNRNYLASVGFGKSFAGGRGKILIGAEIAQNGGVGKMGDRDWGQNRTTINNPAYVAGNGQPQSLLVNDGRASNASYGGLINSPGLLKGIQFGPNGTTLPFTYGTSVTSTTMNGGDGVNGDADYVLASPLKRWAAYGKASYELFDDITTYASFGYGHSSFDEASITGNDQITIKADNAYLPASIKAIMTANNIASFVMGRSLNDYGRGGISQRIHTWQGSGGIKGKIGGSWTFDTSYSYGKTQNLSLFTGDRYTSRWNQALDAVVNPATGGTVCRSTLTDPTNGCVPINLFGVGSASQQAINWITGVSRRNWDITQQVADAVVRGEPFSTWAGPVSIAAGGEWRQQTANVTSDALSIQGVYRVGNVQPFYGRVTVKEGFGEVVVPLAKDESWAKNIDLDIAGRVTDYSTSGTVETWKAGLNYAVNDSIRLRATRSRDIRAPSLNELFAKGATLIYGITDPVLNASYSVNGITSGNPNLKPEKGDTTTAGIVFTPTFIPRFSLSVDYYHIKLKNTINTLTASNIVTRCYTDTPALCSLITRVNGTITQVSLAPANFQSAVESGIDVEVAYRLPIGPSNLDLHGLVNYTDKLDLIDGNTVTHYAGDTEQPSLDGIGGTPHWRANASASFTTPRYRLSLTGRYVGGGVITRTYTTLNGASVNGRLYFDISGEVSLLKTSSGKVSLFGVILNAFDKDPPITGISGYGTTRSLYDMIGRQYTAGVRFSF
jgi:outer membrane receptor protein involved in Fe transport